MRRIYDNLIAKCCKPLNAGVLRSVAAAMVLTVPAIASAEVADWDTYYQATASERAQLMEIDEDYALGVDRFDLDHQTEIIGWQLSHRWYFGRQDGLDSGLTFVWQQNANQQVSVSKDGLRLTRRFK